MPHYRLYLLNPHSGHIDGVEEFHSADDVEAICLTGQRGRDVPAELWCLGRKIARFDGTPEGAAPVPSGATLSPGPGGPRHEAANLH